MHGSGARFWWVLLVATLVLAFLYSPRVETTKAMSHEAFSPAKLDELREAGTPVFVDATADWCITCKLKRARCAGR